MVQSLIMASLKGWKILLTSKNTWNILLAAYTGYKIHEAKDCVQTYRSARNGRIMKEKELEQLKNKLATNATETETNIERTKKEQEEIERALEEAKQLIKEAGKNDPMKEEIERMIRHANQSINYCYCQES